MYGYNLHVKGFDALPLESFHATRLAPRLRQEIAGEDEQQEALGRSGFDSRVERPARLSSFV